MSKIYTKGGIVPDQQDSYGNWLVSFNVTTETAYVQYYTEAGKIWTLMKARCSDVGKYAVEKPTYKFCENQFKDFQEFSIWCFTQEGYLLIDDAGKWQLDKDVLVMGNKIYSPQTCAFLPSYINGIFGNCVKKTELPLGVNYREKFSKFVAQTNLDGKRKHLGHFDNAFTSHKMWQEVKVQAIGAALNKYSTSFGSRQDICDALEHKMSLIVKDIQSGKETLII